MDLEKSEHKKGAGSRGGRIAYYTKSGKPVYGSKVAKMAPQFDKMAENWHHNASNSGRGEDHAIAAKQAHVAAFYHHHNEDHVAAQQSMDYANHHMDAYQKQGHKSRTTAWNDKHHEPTQKLVDGEHPTHAPEKKAEGGEHHDKMMHALKTKDPVEMSSDEKAYHRERGHIKRNTNGNSYVTKQGKAAAAAHTAGETKKSLNQGESIMANEYEDLFKSEIGEQATEDKVLITCPHCDEEITKSEVLAKANGKRGKGGSKADVVKENVQPHKGKVGGQAAYPNRVKSGAKEHDRVNPGSHAAKSEGAELEQVSDDFDPTDDASAEEPEQKAAISKGFGGGGHQLNQWVNTGLDEYVAKSIAEGALGEGGLIKKPIDNGRDPNR